LCSSVPLLFGADLDNALDDIEIGLDFACWERGLFMATWAAFLSDEAKLMAVVLAFIGILGIGFFPFRLDNGFLPSSPVFEEV
tara:strand:- start:415 stop:663 length:249 start_codon:yes stop_codon:yes gene_type:complete